MILYFDLIDKMAHYRELLYEFFLILLIFPVIKMSEVLPFIYW